MKLPFILMRPATHRHYQRWNLNREPRHEKWYRKNWVHLWAICMIIQLMARAIFNGTDTDTGVLLLKISIYANFAMIFYMLTIGNPLFQWTKRNKMLHTGKSPLAGKSVRIKEDVPMIGGKIFMVQDWVDQMPGKKSWLDHGLSNLAVSIWADRRGYQFSENDPQVDEVVYGKVYNLGFVVHIDEIEELKQTSEEWFQQRHLGKLKILDPDGWDRINWDYSWHEEQITEHEYEMRLAGSTIDYPKQKP